MALACPGYCSPRRCLGIHQSPRIVPCRPSGWGHLLGMQEWGERVESCGCESWCTTLCLGYFLAIARETREWMVTLPEALSYSSWKSCSLKKALWWECAKRKLLALDGVCPLRWLSWGRPSPGLPSSWIRHRLIHCRKQKKKQEKTIWGFHGYWTVYFLLTVITNFAVRTSNRCRK